MQSPNDNSDTNKKELNVVFVGSTRVGKTCIIDYYNRKYYEPNPPSTLVATSYTKEYGNSIIRLWDTGGKEKFYSVNLRYFTKQADVVVFVYEPSNMNSFEELKRYVNDVQSTGREDTIFIIVQNKKDITEKVVSENEGKNYAKSIECPFCSVSAATGEGIDDLFNQIIKKIQKRIKPISIVIKKEKSKKHHKCLH